MKESEPWMTRTWGCMPVSWKKIWSSNRSSISMWEPKITSKWMVRCNGNGTCPLWGSLKTQCCRIAILSMDTWSAHSSLATAFQSWQTRDRLHSSVCRLQKWAMTVFISLGKWGRPMWHTTTISKTILYIFVCAFLRSPSCQTNTFLCVSYTIRHHASLKHV